MPEPPSTPFQMHGCRAAVLPVAAAFEQQVQAIEDSIEHVPDFAFDLSKNLVESVCRTVLADLQGQRTKIARVFRRSTTSRARKHCKSCNDVTNGSFSPVKACVF